MKVTRQSVAEKLSAYLRHEISLEGLVNWAERVMENGEIDSQDFEITRDALARLGVADVRAFGLTWEECEQLLLRLGYHARISVVPA